MEDMPRTFRLYEELENSVHGKLSDNTVTYGLDQGDDKSFTNWNGTILGPQGTNFDNRIYCISIVTGEDYPSNPPVLKFQSKINLPFVNQNNGAVDPSKFSMFKNWNKSYTLEKVLIGIKNEMINNKKLPQPADGDMY